MAPMVPRLTLAVCLIAAVAETVLGCTSTSSLRMPGDAVILAFMIGPYALLGLLAWKSRRRVMVSRVLLVVAASLAVWGLYVFGMDSYQYHTQPESRFVQGMAMVVVPLVQWVVIASVGLGLLVQWWLARRRGTASQVKKAPASHRAS